ncbi:MAG: hypothetical protein VX794_03335 [Nitrospinota bacterium]|nr:hypothetical protein [Nitrospinota bacterium]
MGEKWFQFVARIKKEGNHDSLASAMKEASKRKHEWSGNKDKSGPVVKKSKKSKKMRKKSSKKKSSKKKTRKNKKSRGKKSKK